MLDPNLLRTEPDAVAEKLARRGFKLDVDKLRALEERRKVLQVQTENLQAGVTPDRNPLAGAKARGEDIEPLRLEVNKRRTTGCCKIRAGNAAGGNSRYRAGDPEYSS